MQIMADAGLGRGALTIPLEGRAPIPGAQVDRALALLREAETDHESAEMFDELLDRGRGGESIPTPGLLAGLMVDLLGESGSVLDPEDSTGWGYLSGVNPRRSRGGGELAWLLAARTNLQDAGTAVMVATPSAATNSTERDRRHELVRSGSLAAVLQLHGGTMTQTGIPVMFWVVRPATGHARPVLMVNADTERAGTHTAQALDRDGPRIAGRLGELPEGSLVTQPGDVLLASAGAIRAVVDRHGGLVPTGGIWVIRRIDQHPMSDPDLLALLLNSPRIAAQATGTTVRRLPHPKQVQIPMLTPAVVATTAELARSLDQPRTRADDRAARTRTTATAQATALDAGAQPR